MSTLKSKTTKNPEVTWHQKQMELHRARLSLEEDDDQE